MRGKDCLLMERCLRVSLSIHPYEIQMFAASTIVRRHCQAQASPSIALASLKYNLEEQLIILLTKGQF